MKQQVPIKSNLSTGFADFLLLSMASSASLSQALREGEALAAVAPSEMTLGLSLEQSSQRNVIKRIKVMGIFHSGFVCGAGIGVGGLCCVWLCARVCVRARERECMQVCVCVLSTSKVGYTNITGNGLLKMFRPASRRNKAKYFKNKTTTTFEFVI